MVALHHEDAQSADAPPPKRVILLGASNIARGFSTVLQTAQAVCGGPIELMAAIGRGRSYGIESSVMGRRLPGILQCGLWQALQERPRRPAVALVTDIGNDILYGVRPALIAQWVDEALARLERADATIVMTLLPVENLARLSPLRFRVMRRLLFPRNRASLEEITASVLELNDRVRDAGVARGVTLITQQPQWYSIDPIHIQMRSWRRVWKSILEQWPDAQTCVSTKRSLRLWTYLSLLAPEQRTLFGKTRRHEQPIARMKDGTTISLY